LSGILEDGRVYRLYGTPLEFLKYLRGNWKGMGMHGLPEFTSDLIPVILMQCEKSSLQIQLKGNVSLFNRLFQSLTSASEKFQNINLKCNTDRWIVDTDIASYADENYKIEIHAMKLDEMYFLLEKLHPARRILFAGVLKKRKILI
jgi:hypothetical protein